MNISYKLLLRTAVAGLLVAGLSPATDVAAKEYYEGKTISFMVPVAGGSGLDRQARFFTKFFGKHVPGNPKIIVKNMAGAGGATMHNFVYEKARPDGLTVAWGPWNAAGFIAGVPGLRYVPEKFEFIGAGGSYFTTMIRTDAGGSVKKAADVAKTGLFNVGGRRADRAIDVIGNLGLDLIGAKYRYVEGYKGMSKISVAIRRNEVQAGHSGMTGYHVFFKDTMIKEGKAIALWYIPTFDLDGNIEPRSNAFKPDVKSFAEVYEEVHGKKPSGPKWEAMKWFSTNVLAVTQTVFAPPGTPKEAVEALRIGFKGTTQDAEYLKRASRFGEGIRWISLEQGRRIVNTFRNVSPEMKAVFQEMAKKGQK